MEVFGRQVYLTLPSGHVDMFVSPVVHLGKYHYHEMFGSKIMLAAFPEQAWTISCTVIEDGALSPDILMWQRDLSSCCVVCACE